MSIHLNAQSWCPPGAEWAFEVEHSGGLFGPPIEGVFHNRYAEDTVVEGHAAQRIDQWAHVRAVGTTAYTTLPYASMITYYEDGVVHLQRSSGAGFDTLFWFNAEPGQSWAVPEMPLKRFSVLGSTTIEMDGIPLRRLIVQTMHDGAPGPVDTLMERIGFFRFHLRPSNSYWLSPDGITNGMRCYHDEGIDVVRSEDMVCDYDLIIQGSQLPEALIHPNPGRDHFFLPMATGPHLVQVFDATGQMVLSGAVQGPNPRIDATPLSSGLHTIRMDEGPNWRWLKE